MAHLKSLSAPKTWPIERKKKIFIVKQDPGPHTLENAMPLSVVLTDVLKLTSNAREMKKIVSAGKVLINGVVRKEVKFPVGILDTLSVPDASLYYRVLFGPTGQFLLQKITKEQAAVLYVKIANKTTLPGGKMQLNFFNGMNLLTDKKEYKVGDTLVLQGKQVKHHMKFEKGAHVYLIAGKHIGKSAVLEEVLSFKGSQPDRVVLMKGQEKIDTLRAYAFVVDKELAHE
ncbi:MAG: 30S ribosomal protein S4e [Nanoarchaeota archaeon]|nr:30S ribosomal protein S4e [Nanoarchaeota archaeon]